jgi:hypothetical protein
MVVLLVNLCLSRSVIVDHLQTRCLSDKDVICIYVYFDDTDTTGQILHNVYSSLLLQLLRSRIAPSNEISKKYVTGITEFTDDDLLEMLISQAKEFHKVYIVIDALDECSKPNIFLLACQNMPSNVHMLFTSRPQLWLEKLVEPDVKLEIEADADDIKQYLKKSFNVLHNLRNMMQTAQKHDASFLDVILNTIVERSQKM